MALSLLSETNTVLALGIWWNKFSVDGRNINQTTPQDEADMGASSRSYDVRVWVEIT
jgi:hypothetical protein